MLFLMIFRLIPSSTLCSGSSLGACVMCLFALAHAPLVAQTAGGDTLRHVGLGQAEVSAARVMRVEEVIPVQRLWGEELRRMSALSVADAMRFFSGIQVKDYGGIGGLKTINVRSMGTEHSAVFYDGIAIGNAQNGQVDLGRFSLEGIEAVALYNGQRPGTLQTATDYGAAGNVYLQSRTPRFAPGREHNVEVKLRGGSFGTINSSVLWEKKLSEGLALSGAAEGLYTTGRYRFDYTVVNADGTVANDTTATRENGEVRALRTEWGLYGTGASPWRVKAYLYSSSRGLPGAVVRNRFTHEDRQWDTNAFVQGSWRRNIGAWGFLLNAKYAYDYLHYLSEPREEDGTMYVNNHYHRHEGYASGAASLQVSRRITLSLSTDYRLDALRADLYDFAYPVRHSVLNAAAATYAGSAMKAQISVLSTFVHDDVRRGGNAGDTYRLTPFAAVSWQPADGRFSLRAFAKKSFRMPTLNDLYYTFIGNAFLAPEDAVQVNAGGSWKWKSGAFIGEIDVDAYHNYIKNKIVAVPTSNQFRWTMLNLGRVSIWGTDVKAGVGVDLGRDTRLALRLNYTYQSARDVTTPGSAYYRDYIPYIPRHSGSAVARLTLGRWWVDYSFIYTGERYDQQANIAENFVPAWYTSDIAIGRELRLMGAKARATAEVNNVFDQAYEVVKSYPMPGTNFRLSIAFIW